MGRFLLIPIGLLVLVGGAMWWSGGGVEKPANFRFINRGEVGTLDPNRMSWLQDIRVGYALWEGLYTLDPATLDSVPGCARRIDLSDDKKIYTFHIRADARWSNADPVTAGDFVFAWRRMLREPGDYTYLLYCIEGAQAYAEQYAKDPRSADFARVGIEAVDSQTLRVRLKHPVAIFPDLCAFVPFFPLNERSMASFRQEDPTTRRVTYLKGFTRAPDLVGNGPYRLASWEYKRRLRMEANEHYWDRASVRSATIDMINADDPMAAFAMYESGAVDWLAEITGEIAAELRIRGRPDLHVFPGFGTYFYSLNCLPTLPGGKANPFADVRVRQAFAMALDKRPIVLTITRMGELPADTYIPPGVFPEYRSPVGFGHDVARARQLLAEAGFPQGRGFPRISLMFNSEAHHKDVAQNVRRQWQQNLGVDVELEGLEIKVFRQRLHAKDYVIARASWIGDYRDPSTFTDKYLSVSDNNDSGWKNVEYDRLCAAAAVEADATKRLAMFASAEAILCREVPIIPLYYYVNAYLYRDGVSGIALDPRNMVMLKAVAAQR